MQTIFLVVFLSFLGILQAHPHSHHHEHEEPLERVEPEAIPSDDYTIREHIRLADIDSDGRISFQ